MTEEQAVIAREFREFDAFIEAIEDTEVRCTLPCHQTSLWRVTGVCLPGGVHAQLAAMGSGNIALLSADACRKAGPRSACNDRPSRHRESR